MSLDDIWKKVEAEKKAKGLLKSRSTEEVMVSDFEGALQRMIASEIARQLDGRPAPAGQKPLSARAELMFERMRKAVEGVPKPEPSYLPANVAPPINTGTLAPVPVPDGQFQASVLARDNRGRISHARFDGPGMPPIMAMVKERDANGRIFKATFERIAA